MISQHPIDVIPESDVHKGRLEAFSDGVAAIIITIMVLELKTPRSADLAGLKSLWPVLLSYVLSFLYVGIYWTNHHHLFQVSQSVSGRVLWANLLLLFWLSLVPFVTRWMGETHFETWPVVTYGIVLLMCAGSWTVLSHSLLKHHGSESQLANALGRETKELVSLVLYVIALAAAFFDTRISCVIYAAVAAIWIVPDRRIERLFSNRDPKTGASNS